MIVVGIDENGLGPVLGPLVVTAAAFRVPHYDRAALWESLPAPLTAGDSKQVYRSRDPRRSEALVLPWLWTFGLAPGAALEETIALSVDTPCPPQGVVCRAAAPVPLPAFGATAYPLPDQVAAAWNGCSFQPVAARALIACPGMLNRWFDGRFPNKLEVDFHCMMQLCTWFESQYPGEKTVFWCGKIGATSRYGAWFERAGRFVWTAAESRECSTYIGGDSTFHFAVHADAEHVPVAVASMIGKYLRERWMHAFNTAFRPQAPPVSGYRDKHTAAFVSQAMNPDGTATPHRIPAACFVRSR